MKRVAIVVGIAVAILIVLAGCGYVAPITAISGPGVDITKTETPQPRQASKTTTIEITWPKGGKQ